MKTHIIILIGLALGLASCTMFTPKVPFTTTPQVGEAHARFCEKLNL